MPGQQGTARTLHRPRQLPRPKEPYRIKLTPCRLQRSHHLHRRIVRLRRKHRSLRNPLQLLQRRFEPHPHPIKVQRSQLIQSTLPLRANLKFNAVRPVPPAPLRCLQHIPHRLRPIRVCPCIVLRESSCDCPLHPPQRGNNSRRLRQSSHPPQQRVSRNLRPQHRHLAQHIRIELRPRRNTLATSGKVRRQQQPAHSLHRQRPLHPPQQVQRRHHHRQRTQRNPHRKFKRSPVATCRNILQLRCQHLAEHPFNLRSLTFQPRHNHRHPRALPPFQKISRPRGACPQLFRIILGSNQQPRVS